MLTSKLIHINVS